MLILDGQSHRMCVGDEYAALADRLEFHQKNLGSRQESDVGESCTLDGDDVQTEFARPVVDAVPWIVPRAARNFGWRKVRAAASVRPFSSA